MFSRCLARRDVVAGLVALIVLVLLPLYFYGSRVQSAAARFLLSASGGEVAHFPHAGFVSGQRPKITIAPGDLPAWKPFRTHHEIHRRPLTEETAHFTREQINAHKAAVARPLPQGPPAAASAVRDPSGAPAALPQSGASKSSSSFISWDLQLSFRPAEVFFPETIKDLVRIVRQCASRRQKVRVIGSFYSFQPLPESSDVLISSERLNRVVEINGRGRWVHVEAGIKFIDLVWSRVCRDSSRSLLQTHLFFVCPTVAPGTCSMSASFRKWRVLKSFLPTRSSRSAAPCLPDRTASAIGSSARSRRLSWK